MIVAFYSFFIAYAILVFALTLGIARLKRQAPLSSSGKEHTITVLVAVRNEAQHIPALMEDLRQQSYPFDVIFIDDHSIDQTPELIGAAIKNMPHASLLSLGDDSGKKSAIALGVRSATTELIVTTDADCRVGDHWLQALSAAFTGPEVQMVLGPVTVQSAGRWSALQSLEFATVMGVTAGFAAFKKPIMCNGANFAYRKKVFNEVGGYLGNTHVASGDDAFLLSKVAEAFPRGIRMTLEPEALVKTGAAPLGEFLQQRVRWASKWRGHKKKSGAITAVFIFLTHLIALLILPLWLSGEITAIDAGSLLAVKIVAEVVFSITASRALSVKWTVWNLALMELLYSPYVLVVGILANFGTYRWKERIFAVHATRAESVT